MTQQNIINLPHKMVHVYVLKMLPQIQMMNINVSVMLMQAITYLVHRAHGVTLVKYYKMVSVNRVLKDTMLT